MDFLPRPENLKPLSPALENARRKAADYFAARGLPTRKEEEWRYTSVKMLKDRPFVPAAAGARPSHDTLKAVAADLDPRFFNLVFVNGALDRTLSDLSDLPKELEWSETVTAGEDFADSFEALNTAWAGQGATLRLRKDSSLETPLRVHFHTSLENGPALMVNPRFILETGERSSAIVVESYSGQPGASYFVNTHAEIRVGASAKLTHIRLQEESLMAVHIGRSRVRVGENSELLHLVMSTGALLCRHSLDAALEMTGATAKFMGLAALSGEQHNDNTGEIDHRVGGCNSFQTYKNLLDGKSRAVFSGRIRIRKDAQKAYSEQLNNNLLLSSQAEADSQPQLMIEADDVKAAHGSTVGQLNKEELFYLMSRGLSRKAAIPLLAAGFLAELVDLVENETVHGWLLSRLQTALKRLHTEEA